MLPLIYHPIYSQLPLPEGHRYPINKYRYLHRAVQKRCNADPHWDAQVAFFQPQVLELEVVKQTHSSDYVDALVSGDIAAAKMRRIGFPWSEQLITRTLTSAAGTVLAMEKALETGRAIHLSGGYHHAHADFGSGFCLFNDLVIAAQQALERDEIGTVLIVDSDVHHGDGTATLCGNNPDIISLSFHCEKNFPARKPASDLDVPLAIGTQDDEFLNSFEQVVRMAINLHQPDMIIYDAGVDIHQSDELGYLSISAQGILHRDKLLFEIASQAGLPVATVVGGGYRTNHDDLTGLHLGLIEAALAP